MVFCNMGKKNTGVYTRCCHNPYFNRWFSAIVFNLLNIRRGNCHNPYFNRWFSAIYVESVEEIQLGEKVTILILIDGFLQFKYAVFMVF